MILGANMHKLLTREVKNSSVAMRYLSEIMVYKPATNIARLVSMFYPHKMTSQCKISAKNVFTSFYYEE